MQLTGLGLLSGSCQWSIAPSQMRQGRRIRQPIQHLRNTRLGRHALVSPIASRQTVLEAVRDVIAFDGGSDVEVLAFVQTPLQVLSYIFSEFAEQYAEQSAQQRAGQIQPLLPKMIAIVFVGAAQPAHEQLVNRVANEESLFVLAMFFSPHVWQHFLLQ